jgi:FtsP/CotA-like multicopper oxidase with cupredoxin domain
MVALSWRDFLAAHMSVLDCNCACCLALGTVWDVVNTTMMDHPFHLHGFFFQVIEIDGKKPAWRSVEDVINVPPKTTVRIAWYPDDRPGMWMYHCHIVEHHAAGMMAHFEVVR